MSQLSVRKAARWLGTAMVAFGIACFPFAIWFPGPWGVISLLLVTAGCFFLVGGMRGQVPDPGNAGAAPEGEPRH